MTTTNKTAAASSIDVIMEQAQTFASTWSLVGHVAFGTTIEEANAEKAALESMLRAALAAPAQPSQYGSPELQALVLARCVEKLTPAQPAAWAATSEDGDVEALGMNESRRFDTPLYKAPQPPAREQEDALLLAATDARDWFEQQAKAVSKGCGSSYELWDLRAQRDLLDAAIAARQGGARCER